MVDMVGVIAAFVLKVHAGADGSVVEKVIVHAVATLMPVICPLLLVDPLAKLPLPHTDTTGVPAVSIDVAQPTTLLVAVAQETVFVALVRPLPVLEYT